VQNIKYPVGENQRSLLLQFIEASLDLGQGLNFELKGILLVIHLGHSLDKGFVGEDTMGKI
jgi:hypothetical protein